jgi:hypothetical protein
MLYCTDPGELVVIDGCVAVVSAQEDSVAVEPYEVGVLDAWRAAGVRRAGVRRGQGVRIEGGRAQWACKYEKGGSGRGR